MPLSYAFTETWNNSIKDLVREWVKVKLTVVQDDGTVDAPEDLFLEYIIVMISNGKQMQELSQQLRDFIGEENADQFAADLGTYLRTLTTSSDSEIPLSNNKSEQVQPRVASVVSTKAVTTTSNDDLVDVNGNSKIGKKNSRQSQQQVSRLLDNALRSTTASQKPRESQKGFTTQASRQREQAQSQGNVVQVGFSTKKGGSSSSAMNDSNQGNVQSEIKGISTKRGISNLNQEKELPQSNGLSSGSQQRQNAQLQSQGNTSSGGLFTKKGGSSNSATVHPNQNQAQPEIAAPSVGLSTKRGISNLNQDTMSSQSNTISGGLSTRREDSSGSDIPSNESKEGGDSGKRRKIVLGDPPKRQFNDRTVSYEANGPGISTNRNSINKEIVGGFESFNGHNNDPTVNDHHIGGSSTDPSLIYLEQMNKMARMSGFGSVEEMMTFQQNMIANMMAQGGMPNIDQHQMMNQQQQYQQVYQQQQYQQPAQENQQQQQQYSHQQQGGGRFQGRGRGGRSGPGRGMQINSGGDGMQINRPPPPPSNKTQTYIPSPATKDPTAVVKQQLPVSKKFAASVVTPALQATEALKPQLPVSKKFAAPVTTPIVTVTETVKPPLPVSKKFAAPAIIPAQIAVPPTTQITVTVPQNRAESSSDLIEGAVEGQECVFGYSFGGGPGGVRGRGRGRGAVQGRGYQGRGYHAGIEGSEVPSYATEEVAPSGHDYTGGRFPVSGRGRGAYRGRGFNAGMEGSAVSSNITEEAAPSGHDYTGGRFPVTGRGRGSYRGRGGYNGGRMPVEAISAPLPPRSEKSGSGSTNKVWIRESNIENPLISGR